MEIHYRATPGLAKAASQETAPGSFPKTMPSTFTLDPRAPLPEGQQHSTPLCSCPALLFPVSNGVMAAACEDQRQHWRSPKHTCAQQPSLTTAPFTAIRYFPSLLHPSAMPTLSSLPTCWILLLHEHFLLTFSHRPTAFRNPFPDALVGNTDHTIAKGVLGSYLYHQYETYAELNQSIPKEIMGLWD